MQPNKCFGKNVINAVQILFFGGGGGGDGGVTTKVSIEKSTSWFETDQRWLFFNAQLPKIKLIVYLTEVNYVLFF